MKLTLATATSMDYAVCVAAVFSGTACFPSKGIRQRTFENLVWLVWRLGQYQTLSGLAGATWKLVLTPMKQPLGDDVVQIHRMHSFEVDRWSSFIIYYTHFGHLGQPQHGFHCKNSTRSKNNVGVWTMSSWFLVIFNTACTRERFSWLYVYSNYLYNSSMIILCTCLSIKAIYFLKLQNLRNPMKSVDPKRSGFEFGTSRRRPWIGMIGIWVDTMGKWTKHHGPWQ